MTDTDRDEEIAMTAELEHELSIVKMSLAELQKDLAGARAKVIKAMESERDMQLRNTTLHADVAEAKKQLGIANAQIEKLRRGER